MLHGSEAKNINRTEKVKENYTKIINLYTFLQIHR